MLTKQERKAKEQFIRAVETLMLDLDAEAVGRIADHVGEHGTNGDGGSIEDGSVVECVRVIVDAMGGK